MPVITFLPSGAQVQAAEGETLFEVGGRAHAGIQTSCVGKGTCGLCRVKIIAGGDALSTYTEEETKHLGNLYHVSKLRLACRTRVFGDATVEVRLAPVRKKP